MASLNDEMPYLSAVLSEIERALQSYDVSTFTKNNIQTLRDYVETNEYMYTSRIMSEVNKPRSIRATFTLQIHVKQRRS